MYKQNSLITRYCLAVAVVLALLGPLASQSRGDFVLRNDEWLVVNSPHNQGTLYDRSRASFVPSGFIGYPGLYAYNSSTVDISGGAIRNLVARNSSVVNISSGAVIFLDAYDSSTLNISGGSVGYLNAYNSNTVDISGGWIYNLLAGESSAVDISGGVVNDLGAYNSSVVTFHGLNFSASGGLILDGERVLGRGILSGEWMDGTPWRVGIYGNDPTATILAIPEPATLLLLGLGAVMLRRKR